MRERILSASVLWLLAAGMTIYGYNRDAQTASVPAQSEALLADADSCDTDPISSDASADPEGAGAASGSPAADETDLEKAEPALPDSPAFAKEHSSKTPADISDPPIEPAGTDDMLPDADDIDAAAVDLSKITVFPEPKTMYVQTPVNIRKGPGTSYDKIGFVQTNEELTVLGQYENDGWYHFIYHDEDAFVSNLYVSEIMVEPVPASTEQAQTEEAAPAEPSQTPAAQPEPAPQPAAAAGVLFIGDSRCVQMKEAVAGGGCTWICENAKGYSWLTETALARADSVVGKGTKVVMCLGVNDTRNCDSYAAIMNQKAAEWAEKGAKTYFVSVNPVWENPYTSEEQVENFNASIVGQLSGVTWIDTHSWLTANGYRLVDGLHYDANTYINIFHVIIGSL